MAFFRCINKFPEELRLLSQDHLSHGDAWAEVVWGPLRRCWISRSTGECPYQEWQARHHTLGHERHHPAAHRYEVQSCCQRDVCSSIASQTSWWQLNTARRSASRFHPPPWLSSLREWKNYQTVARPWDRWVSISFSLVLVCEGLQPSIIHTEFSNRTATTATVQDKYAKPRCITVRVVYRRHHLEMNQRNQEQWFYELHYFSFYFGVGTIEKWTWRIFSTTDTRPY